MSSAVSELAFDVIEDLRRLNDDLRGIVPFFSDDLRGMVPLFNDDLRGVLLLEAIPLLDGRDDLRC